MGDTGHCSAGGAGGTETDRHWRTQDAVPVDARKPRGARYPCNTLINQSSLFNFKSLLLDAPKPHTSVVPKAYQTKALLFSLHTTHSFLAFSHITHQASTLTFP